MVRIQRNRQVSCRAGRRRKGWFMACMARPCECSICHSVCYGVVPSWKERKDRNGGRVKECGEKKRKIMPNANANTAISILLYTCYRCTPNYDCMPPSVTRSVKKQLLAESNNRKSRKDQQYLRSSPATPAEPTMMSTGTKRPEEQESCH